MLDALPAGDEIELRDRAVIAFALLSGARDRAIVSFKLKHIDVENELIEQDAREVRTKRAAVVSTSADRSRVPSSPLGYIGGRDRGALPLERLNELPCQRGCRRFRNSISRRPNLR
jgi:integrase